MGANGVDRGLRELRPNKDDWAAIAKDFGEMVEKDGRTAFEHEKRSKKGGGGGAGGESQQNQCVRKFHKECRAKGPQDHERFPPSIENIQALPCSGLRDAGPGTAR